MKLEFSRQFSKNTQRSNFMIIRPVGADLFRADTRTDRHEANRLFRNFVNAPKTVGTMVHL